MPGGHGRQTMGSRARHRLARFAHVQIRSTTWRDHRIASHRPILATRLGVMPALIVHTAGCLLSPPRASFDSHVRTWGGLRPHPPRSPIVRRARPCAQRAVRAVRAHAVASTQEGFAALPEGPVVLWFKRDLRTGDHLGLVGATAGRDRSVVCVYVVDDTLLALEGQSLGLTIACVAALRSQCRALGGDLVVRRGESVAEVLAIARSIGASCVVTEDDVDAWRDAVERMEATGMHVVRWKSVAYKDHLYGQNYPEFVRRRGTPLTPLDPPSSLPPLPPGLVVGELPSRPWDSPEAVVPLGTHHFPYVLPEFVGSMTAQEAWERIASLVGEGEGRVLETLREIAAGRAGAEVRPLLRSLAVTAAPGQAVAALLAPAVALGVVSPRQVLAEARRGPVWHSDSYASSMAKVAELWDWHAQLARVGETGSKLRHWRWAGQLLTNYVVCSPPGSSPDPARPAVLLVHGFGAFAEHWRDNMQPLAARGFDVFAVTLPGFGRSEKPPLQYSQYLWRDTLVDFVRTVVCRPVIVVGNSIGGYVSALFAGTHPDMVEGLVLLNTAGKIDPGYVHSPDDKCEPARPARALVDVVSQLLFLYLQLGIQSTLRRLYPTNPDRADKWLADEIERASSDPGALGGVFKAGAYLPRPVPLNYLVDALGKPTLVLQGALDPLNDAPGRARDLARCCPNVEVVMLQAGHCPHDEVPDEVNDHLAAFATRCCKLSGLVIGA